MLVGIDHRLGWSQTGYWAGGTAGLANNHIESSTLANSRFQIARAGSSLTTFSKEINSLGREAVHSLRLCPTITARYKHQILDASVNPLYFTTQSVHWFSFI